MENKEIITENELLELANKHIRLEQEYEDYIKVTLKLIFKLKNEIKELKKQIK